ncbi:MAG: hypothetical protein P8R42_07605 [Candidatus Binatia bacterium]|nr:hypothetical protein [Candidatus Binatia bacterium]
MVFDDPRETLLGSGTVFFGGDTYIAEVTGHRIDPVELDGAHACPDSGLLP